MPVPILAAKTGEARGEEEAPAKRKNPQLLRIVELNASPVGSNDGVEGGKGVFEVRLVSGGERKEPDAAVVGDVGDLLEGVVSGVAALERVDGGRTGVVRQCDRGLWMDDGAGETMPKGGDIGGDEGVENLLRGAGLDGRAGEDEEGVGVPG